MAINHEKQDYVCRRMSVTIPKDLYPNLESELVKVQPGQGRVRRLLTLADIGALLLRRGMRQNFLTGAYTMGEPEDHSQGRSR